MPTSDLPPDNLSWPSDQEAATMAIQDWRHFFARQRYREHDATLTALQAAAAVVSPPCTALCSLSGSAHGYALQFTILQFSEPTFAWYTWDAATQQLTDPRPIDLTLDLHAEFQRLQSEAIVLRGAGNSNIDSASGVEGRVATMFLVVGSEAEWIEFSSPLDGGVYRNIAINRIFRELMGMQQSIKLTDEAAQDHP
jgi:hypothetical protein